MNKAGITTTIPLEVPLAAGWKVIDLNNMFINHPDKYQLVEYAEAHGFPRNTCCWIKGIYGIAKQSGITTVIAVTEGDCSNTHALMEVLQCQGKRVIPFAYPYNRNPQLLTGQLEVLIETFQTSWEEVNRRKKQLDAIRQKVWEIDRLTWQENKVSSWENHFYQVSCSDMAGNPKQFERELNSFLKQARQRPPLSQPIRLGYLGVPPIFPEIYDYLETLGTRVVYNEIQRQFSMPSASSSLLEQYQCYTYPYDIFTRLQDIKTQIQQRQIQGLIHYVQSFCFRQIEDIIIRQQIKLPILTLEGDTPLPLDTRTKLRLESFVESLQARQSL